MYLTLVAVRPEVHIRFDWFFTVVIYADDFHSLWVHRPASSGPAIVRQVPERYPYLDPIAIRPTGRKPRAGPESDVRANKRVAKTGRWKVTSNGTFTPSEHLTRTPFAVFRNAIVVKLRANELRLRFD